MTLLSVAILVAFATTAGAVTASMLLMDREEGGEGRDPGAATPVSVPASPSAAEPSASGGPSNATPSPSGGDEVQGSPSALSADIGCWDGSTVSVLAACSLPYGAQGLSWLFPASDAEGCSVLARSHHGRVVDRYCSVVLPTGGEVQFHYSQWRDFDEMRLNYRADQVGSDLQLSRDDLHAFGVFDADAAHKVAVFYRLPDAPWSVTVYAPSVADLESALGLLEVRPVKQLRGVGRQQQHLPASFSVLPDPAG